jgi:hypothetical protein
VFPEEIVADKLRRWVCRQIALDYQKNMLRAKVLMTSATARPVLDWGDLIQYLAEISNERLEQMNKGGFGGY